MEELYTSYGKKKPSPASIYGINDELSTSWGSGLDAGSNKEAVPEYGQTQATDYSGAAKGATAAMNAGGSAGSTLTSAGLYSMNPYMIGGGLALSVVEGDAKNKAANERARVEEAQQRKIAVQNALNQALGATRQLGV